MPKTLTAPPRPPRPSGDPASTLRLYRILLFVGGLVLVGIGMLYRLGTPAGIDPTAGRLALGLSAVALGALTFVNAWVYRHALKLAAGFFVLVSAWQIGLAYVNSLSATSAFGLVLVYVGCSAGLQRPRSLGIYSSVFVLATVATAYAVAEPLVPREAFLATLAALAVLGPFVAHMRAEALARLDAAREEALAAARAKSDFLATMSHEIRTPLNGVLGMTDVLATTRLSAEQQDCVDTIRASGDVLLGLISDVLDFSKIEAGHVELEARPVPVRALVDDVLDVAAASGLRRGVELVGRVRPDVPEAIVGDSTRLRQIALNLVSNAVKFTEVGSVVVDVQALAGPRRGLRVSVVDTGIGIAPERMASLFESFTQGDASTTRRFGGTGLGLAISKRLAERMGGELRAESVPGEGSTFTADLPLPAAAPPPLPPALRPGDARPGVLVVLAHPAARAAAAESIPLVGAEAAVAASVEEALAELDGGALAGGVSVVVVDAEVGGEAGASAARRLCADVRLATCAVVRVVRPGATRTSRPADTLVAAPLSGSRLADAVARLLREATRDAPAAESAVLLPPLRVLLAEDHAVNQRVAVGLLRHLGLEPVVVADGRAAVEAICDAAGDAARAFDVVLMDVQMPEMDGLDATRLVRARLPPEQQPTIIALTANAVTGDAERCLDAGMDAYLPKPVRLEALRAALAEVPACARFADAPSPAAASAPPARAATPPPDRFLWATAAVPEPVHVAAHLRALAQGDDALADEILEVYLRTDLDLVAQLERSATVAEAAHKLKASSGTLGADGLAARADALERAARAGADTVADARALADDLRAFHDVAALARDWLAAVPPVSR